MAKLNFNASSVEPTVSFQPVPDGWYNVMITESEMKPTKDGSGAYLELGMKILDGDHAGRMLYDRLNIQNKNPVAVEIAYRTLSAICHVTGVLQLQDSQQLHGIPFQAKVVVRPASNGYDASNDIKGYRDANGNEPGKQSFAAPAQQAAPPQ